MTLQHHCFSGFKTEWFWYVSEKILILIKMPQKIVPKLFPKKDWLKVGYFYIFGTWI
jgi:hypothetical protein